MRVMLPHRTSVANNGEDLSPLPPISIQSASDLDSSHVAGAQQDWRVTEAGAHQAGSSSVGVPFTQDCRVTEDGADQTGSSVGVPFIKVEPYGSSRWAEIRNEPFDRGELDRWGK